MSEHLKGLLITTLGVLFIVPDSLFVRLIDADSLTIAFWRSLLSGLVILILMLAWQGRGAMKSMRDTGKPGLVYAVFMGASGIFFVVAVDNTSIANVVFIIASMPLFAALFSRLFLGEAISRRMILTIFGVTIGLGIIAFGSSGDGARTSLFGDAMALGSAASFAAALTAARKQRAVSMIPAIPLAYIGAALVLWPFSDVLNVVPAQWWLFALHGGVVIVLSTSLLALGPRYITSAEVSLLMLLESILAPLMAWGVLAEFPGTATLIGGAVVMAILIASNLLVLRRTP